MAKKKRGRHGKGAAAKADKHTLYQDSVQDPELDLDLAERVFRRFYDRPARKLREDFSGTALMACDWVKRHKQNFAWAIDLDPDPLDWGREHNVSQLSEEQSSRVELILDDVMVAKCEPVDINVAFNFSYFLFQTRDELLAYFRKAHSTLGEQGLFMIDIYGGADAQRTMTENREFDGFEYVWDQHIFDPITNHVVNYIHFEFPDGSRIKRAFHYDWRLWSLPELKDILRDAGFSQTDVYWEGTDQKTGEGSGVYHRSKSAIDDPAWVAYIAAFV